MLKRFTLTLTDITRIKIICCAGCLMVTLAGCGGPQVQKIGPVFFPAPPNPPRVQFLKGIAGSTDVEDPKNEFALFLTGGSRSEQAKPINRPYGIRVVKGKLYVCDTQGLPTIITIDLVNRKFEYLKGNYGVGKLKKPINLAVDDKGNIFVADTARKEIVMYNAAGEYLRAYGKEIGMKPVDVEVDNEFIYALDIGKSEIHIINRETGQLDKSIGKPIEGATVGLAIPTNFALDDKGQFYITNVGTGSVVKMDRDGHVTGSFGKIGDSFGEFTRPKGIAVDKQGFIYVIDGGVQNAQLFNQNFRILLFFGDPPLPAGALNLPAGVAVSTDNLDYFQKFADPGFVLEQVIYVTNQMGNDKISIYGLGHKKEAADAAKSAEQSKQPGDGKDGKTKAPESEKTEK